MLPVVLPETANATLADATALPGPTSEGSIPVATTSIVRPTRRTAADLAARAAALQQQLADPAVRAAAREAIRERVRLNPPPAVRPAHVPRGGFWTCPDYDDYQPTEAEIDAEITANAAKRKQSTRKAVAKAERTVDPRLVAMSRALRDRWMEHADGAAALPANAGKYTLGRRMEAHAALPMPTVVKALPAAA